MANVVTEATGAAIADATLDRHRFEGARTNRCIQGCEFDTASWVSGGGGIAVDDQATAGPDGTTTADTLTASGANGTLIQDLGVVASAAKTFSIWLKRKTGTGNIDLTLDGGTGWTTKAITSSWAKYEITQTLADEDAGIRIVTSGDEVYACFAQVETAAFSSSSIPTTTIAVARNADVLSWPSSGNIVAAQGTVFCKFTPTHAPSGTIALFGTYVDADNYTAILHDATNIIMRKRIAGVNYDATKALTFAAGTTYRIAGRWGAAGVSVFVDGVKGTDNADATAAQIAATMQIGADGNSLQQPFADIGDVRIWTTALSDVQVASLGIS